MQSCSAVFGRRYRSDSPRSVHIAARVAVIDIHSELKKLRKIRGMPAFLLPTRILKAFSNKQGQASLPAGCGNVQGLPLGSFI